MALQEQFSKVVKHLILAPVVNFSTLQRQHEVELTFGKYTVKNPFAKGGFGSVYKCWDSELQQNVALKVIHKKRLNQMPEVTALAREIDALETFSDGHYFVKFHKVIQTNDFFVIVMDFVSGETLDKFKPNKKMPMTPLKEPYVRKLFLQLLDGLSEMHEKNFVHRDLKPANVFLTDDDGIKIGDFGFAKQVGTDVVERRNTFLGTPGYMAPELFSTTYVNSDATKMDSWSVGIMMFEFGCGFARMDTRSPVFGSCHISADLKELIQNLLEINPKDRMSIVEAKKKLQGQQDAADKKKAEDEAATHAASEMSKKRAEESNQQQQQTWQNELRQRVKSLINYSLNYIEITLYFLRKLSNQTT